MSLTTSRGRGFLGLNKSTIEICIFNNSVNKGGMLLEYVKTEYPFDKDVDIAIVRVKKIILSKKIIIEDQPIEIERKIFLIGAGDQNDLPKLCFANIVTTYKERLLTDEDDKKKKVRTLKAIGTNLISFPGQSGSPVYTLEGKLLGIYVSGIKWYAKTGESLKGAPQNPKEWDDYSHWSWVIPLFPYQSQILNFLQEN